MSNYAAEKKLISQLITIKKEKRPSEAILKSLYAQAIIEHSIFRYQKEKLLNDINDSLDFKDKKRFIILTEKYKLFLDEYRNGKRLYEKGFELKIIFDI